MLVELQRYDFVEVREVDEVDLGFTTAAEVELLLEQPIVLHGLFPLRVGVLLLGVHGVAVAMVRCLVAA